MHIHEKYSIMNLIMMIAKLRKMASQKLLMSLLKLLILELRNVIFEVC